MITYKERQEAMTEFRKDPSLDVYTIRRKDGTYITITRTNEIKEWK